jgi:UDP-N-acetylmuramoyl-L-alanyl-D-glutamate--2,6-diaminopimelate ligase
MTSVRDIRPLVEPLPLPQALAGVDVLEWVDAPGAPARGAKVSGVTVSTLDVDPGWLFVAIPGLTQHGIRFAHRAALEGAAAILTDPVGARDAAEEGLGLPVAVVGDPRAASAAVAATVYGHPARRLRTMAVTGTNGKTTTSYLMRAALGAAHEDAALCGTVETRVGDLRILSDHTTGEAPVVERILALAGQKGLGAAVVETSAHALSLNRVDGIVFDVAAFTNLQHDHLDYYHDMEHYFAAKRSLFTPAHSRQGVVCVDDEWGRRLAREAEVPITTVSALTDEPAQWTVRDAHVDADTSRTVFTLVSPDGAGHAVATPVLGDVNVQNAALAIVSAVRLGLDVDAVIAAVERAEQVPGRMEKVNPVPDPRQPLVVVDYAHTPEGLEWTLASTREFTRGRIVLVFGTDGDRDPTKREPLAAIAARRADDLWVTDENPRTEDAASIRAQLLHGIASVRPDLARVTEVATCRRDAVRRAILAAGPRDTVLITGKGAEWYQDIDGIKHAYNDVPVSREVLGQDPRARV